MRRSCYVNCESVILTAVTRSLRTGFGHSAKKLLAVAVRRFETPPGKQAQVDWGHLGSLHEDGTEHPLWGFAITMGYSRRMKALAATDQKLGTLLRMHEAAFMEWGARAPGDPLRSYANRLDRDG